MDDIVVVWGEGVRWMFVVVTGKFGGLMIDGRSVHAGRTSAVARLGGLWIFSSITRM